MKTYTGKDLIELGYQPDKWFGDVLKTLNIASSHCGEDGVAENFVRRICEEHKPPPYILPHNAPKPYVFNMDGNTPDEVSNMQKVIETMDELMKVPTIKKGAVMPDACPTGPVGQIPVGGVVIAENAIHPNFHSADICCSVMATCLGEVDPKHVMDIAEYATHFGYGGRNDGIYKLQRSMEQDMITNLYLGDLKTIEKAKTHLGTQGDGNHFLFVGHLESTGEVWMVTHHGSRGVGADLFKKGMKEAERFRRKLSPKTDKRNAWIPYDTMQGREYWEALQVVRRWTKLNHEVIHKKIAEILSVDIRVNFWNEHNFVFKKGTDFYHAKGATPLLREFVPDGLASLRLIPLNMAEPILIVKGEENDRNLGFAPHGAGRNISRSEHKRRLQAKGLTLEQALEQETEGLDVRFFAGAPDSSELPSAYKSAKQVQEQIEKFGLGEVDDRIMPYGSIMAGEQDKPWFKNKGKKG